MEQFPLPHICICCPSPGSLWPASQQLAVDPSSEPGQGESRVQPPSR